MRPRPTGIIRITCCLLAATASLSPAAGEAALEADWLTQARTQTESARKGAGRQGRISTADDAAGAVDGVKDGKWGFHTANEREPWWQVDLGRARPLGRMAVYNRCDATAGRNARLIVLLGDDGKTWRRVYQHDGKTFYGQTDKKPLVIEMTGRKARFVRIQLPGTSYFHLDEVEIYAPDDAKKNIALGRPADQSSTSTWSSGRRAVLTGKGAADLPIAEAVRRGLRLAEDLAARAVDTGPAVDELKRVAAEDRALPADATGERRKQLYFRARRAVRALALSNPLLDFDSILITKRQPGSYSHMSDQYYGWWSRPGGGIYVLEGIRTGRAKPRCITDGLLPPGSFLRPDLSYDAKRVLFAYCRHYPATAGLGNKVHKPSIPEDAFYQLYEMNIDGTGLRRLTRGRYDDFDGRYLPDGQIVFLSTRRGQFFQCGRSSAMATLSADLPDSYVRCGGGNRRPVAIYTLHVMGADGKDLRAISPFENFEWTPSVAADGRILYARWDYVDRHNNAYMSLWSTNPDGTNPQGVYGNFTRTPHAIFEARAVPNSNKIVFTASAHHSITGGSLVLLDADVGQDDFAPITRMTPEVCFPEIEGWPATYYANPYPLSETHHLAAWSPNPLRREGGGNPGNSLGVYLFDAFGNLVLLHRDPDISTMYPIPIRPRKAPPVISDRIRRHDDGKEDDEGRMMLVNVYDGLAGAAAGSVKRLRIVGVPAKVQPQMNSPSIGVTREDPGKCVLGTVPIEADGSAYFRLPAGVNVFFQALDAHGRAVQTMRTVTYVQPGQTLSCIGCHEPRSSAPPRARPLASLRAPSKLTPGPPGTWPLRYDRLVQPVLDKHCTRCHKPGGEKKAIARLDLTAGKSYGALMKHGGGKALEHNVRTKYLAGRSAPGQTVALASSLPAMFLADKPHSGVRLGAGEIDRLMTWLDTYAQRLGSFSNEQEARLLELRRRWADMIDAGRLRRPEGSAGNSRGRKPPVADSQ